MAAIGQYDIEQDEAPMGCLTEISTIFNQYVFPTRSLESTTAPCNPVYVHLDRLGYATKSFATATAWILLVCLGTNRLTVSLSSSLRMDGMVRASS